MPSEKHRDLIKLSLKILSELTNSDKSIRRDGGTIFESSDHLRKEHHLS